MTSYHMRQSVEGALRNRAFGHFSHPDGTPMSEELAEHRLTELLASGVKYIPCGDCDNWSPTEGCLGHEKCPDFIRIDRATDPTAWYATRIGEVLPVELIERNVRPSQGIPEDVYWCREGGTYNPINYVRKSDATEVSP